MSENIARTPREGLDQQLAELGTLRNAGTRSPSFRAWRQATLTLLQRIWPGDPGVSERFRRIPFSPNHSRGDANEVRNIYEKGCAEANSVLRELRDRIGDQGWGEVERSAYSESFEVGSTEDDFPTLDLPPGNGQRSAPRPPARSKSKNKSKPATARGTDLGDLLKEAESKDRPGSPSLSNAESRVIPPDPESQHTTHKSRGRRSSPGTRKGKDRLKDMLGFHEGATPDAPEPSSPAEQAAAPARPAVEIPLVPVAPPVAFAPPITAMPPVPPAPTAMPPVPGPPPLAAAPPPVAPLPPVAIPTVSPPVAVTPPPVPILPSDLLREFENSPPPPAPPPPAVAPPPPAAAVPPRVEPPAARPPTLNDMLMTPDFTARLEASIDPNEWVSPSVPGPEELEQGLPPEPRATDLPPSPRPPVTSHPEVFTSMEAFGLPQSAAHAPPPVATPSAAPTPPVFAPPPAAPPPAAYAPPAAVPPPPARADVVETENVTEEFFRTSPVLSSMGGPVRRKDAPEAKGGYLVPEAVEILAIAGQAAELGVPESRRPHARAYLAELARRLENHDLTWETLRDSVQFLMEFPPLARRVLPLLLPFLDQAA